MATQKTFDFHFHLLFKHFVTKGYDLDKNMLVPGLAQLLDEIFGGFFDSQSSPQQVSRSPLALGVTSILAVEHAFANKILSPLGVNLSGILPLDWDLFKETKNGQRTYYDEFNRQVQFHLEALPFLQKPPYNIEYLNRTDKKWIHAPANEIEQVFINDAKRYLAFSIEGGHNLSNVPIRNQTIKSKNPELQLKEIQERADIDFISMNLCHLSDIPEQTLGGFAQGLNRTAQIAFKSDDFMPKNGLGLTEPGKRVIRQALLHDNKPILIDIKHMSVYTRFHYYRFREKLIEEQPAVARLPIISSHTGFTFTSLDKYLSNKLFQSRIERKEGIEICSVTPENQQIGKTNDRKNAKLYANTWSISLFDEEIIEIIQSKGMIGVSMDQRVLGASKTWRDGQNRPKYYEEEFIATPEWQKLFRDGQLPTAEEGLVERILRTPTRAERHIMLFCTHLVHAVKVGYASLAWLEGTSPWDHLCIGSDFDGLINPLNGYKDITDMKNFEKDLKQYLPIADKFIVTDGKKALKYNDAGEVNQAFLEEVIDKVLFLNGVRFTTRFLKNWQNN